MRRGVWKGWEKEKEKVRGEGGGEGEGEEGEDRWVFRERKES